MEERPSYNRRIVNIGDRYGLFVVTKILPSKCFKSGRKSMYECLCDCGTTKVVQGSNLFSGNSSSCGTCVAKEARFAGYNLKCKRPDGEVNRDECYKSYRACASSRNLSFELTLDVFLHLTQQKCHYCGISPSNSYQLKFCSGPKKGEPRAGKAFVYNGIDRINNDIGYVESNCVACCGICNKAKTDREYSEFLEWVGLVYRNLKLEN